MALREFNMNGKKNRKELCKKGTYDIKKNKGKCKEDCKNGAWNGGICGAECLKCGGVLFLSKKGVVCSGCGLQNTKNKM